MPKSNPTKQTSVTKSTPASRATTSRKRQASNADEIQQKRAKPNDDDNNSENEDQTSNKEAGKGLRRPDSTKNTGRQLRYGVVFLILKCFNVFSSKTTAQRAAQDAPADAAGPSG